MVTAVHRPGLLLNSVHGLLYFIEATLVITSHHRSMLRLGHFS